VFLDAGVAEVLADRRVPMDNSLGNRSLLARLERLQNEYARLAHERKPTVAASIKELIKLP
jgi:hypothetical protein